MAIALGDTKLGKQALLVAVSVNPDHAESYTNLGVLEAQSNKVDAAMMHYERAQRIAPWLYEPFYNGGT